MKYSLVVTVDLTALIFVFFFFVERNGRL